MKKAIYTLASMNHVVDLARLLGLANLCGEVDATSYHVLLEMYSNCGLADEASSVFEGMSEKNLDTWYVIIRCLAKNRLGEDAIDMFTRFKNE